MTLQTQLLPDKEQSAAMKQTVERFNAACSWLAEQAFAVRLSNKVKLQQLHYRDLREKFGLSAQMAAICIRHVGGTYSRDKDKLPKFRKHAAMPYDSRILSFKGVDRVSLLTLSGRVIVPFVMGKYQRERFTNAIGQSDLVLRKDGRWFLLVTVNLPDKTPTPATDFVGVDFGITNIATTSDGEVFSGAEVEQTRQRHHALSQTLQHKASKQSQAGKRPRSIHKLLIRKGGQEARFRSHTNHCISKKLVASAIGTQRGIALEDLQGIRKRIEKRFRRSQRAKVSGWSFFQLRQFITYKAQLSGITLALVDPRNTSRTCAACGHCAKENRKSQAEFECVNCHHQNHADINAAINIRGRAIVNSPQVSERAVSKAA
ncbi:MAG: IS200/IS605 family element transposase accessory protein TnpB [Acidobacteria bacterium]|nr:IS200/IS605 family element transposase accessory protein TnpB [Acidobacteriota bacterium]